MPFCHTGPWLPLGSISFEILVTLCQTKYLSISVNFCRNPSAILARLGTCSIAISSDWARRGTAERFSLNRRTDQPKFFTACSGLNHQRVVVEKCVLSTIELYVACFLNDCDTILRHDITIIGWNPTNQFQQRVTDFGEEFWQFLWRLRLIIEETEQFITKTFYAINCLIRFDINGWKCKLLCYSIGLSDGMPVQSSVMGLLLIASNHCKWRCMISLY